MTHFRLLFEGKLEGRTRRGRPGIAFSDQIKVKVNVSSCKKAPRASRGGFGPRRKI